jgi:hypothetical protein
MSDEAIVVDEKILVNLVVSRLVIKFGPAPQMAKTGVRVVVHEVLEVLAEDYGVATIERSPDG